MKLPLATKSGEGRSVPLNPEKLVNLYAEVAPEGSRSPVVVRGVPGTTVFAQNLKTEIDSQFCTIYMTRFANGTNADISPNNTVPTETGTGHDYSGGAYNISKSAGEVDYFTVDLSPFYTLGEPFLVEALVEWESSDNFSLMPFLSLNAAGDSKEFGWQGDNGGLDFDTATFGRQWGTFPNSVPAGAFHIAIQAEFNSGTTYDMRVYYLGNKVFEEQFSVASDPIASVYFGPYESSITPEITMKFYEVAVRCENKYTANFTPPTTLDDP